MEAVLKYLVVPLTFALDCTHGEAEDTRLSGYMVKYTFLQLKMANRQNCLNAGAKLDIPPRVGAERLAVVRD